MTMGNRYLWDGSGDPDPEIVKLEETLAKFRHSDAPLDLGAVKLPASEQPRRKFTGWWPKLGFAAAGLAFVAIAVVMLQRGRITDNPPQQSGWKVVRSHNGTASVSPQEEHLQVGNVLRTDSRSSAKISVDDLGELEVEPNTTLRLLSSGKNQKQISVERGTIHATIWAPPGEFVVETPSATAVDLGCVYTLHVNDHGEGLLKTTLGWVGFKFGENEAFIPAGAACATRPQRGPGTPYFEDSSDEFRSALTKIDFGNGGTERTEALTTVLSKARKRDAMSLWHLLTRVEGADRERVYDRLAALVPPPTGVTRDGVLRAERGMLDLWWNELGEGDISLWRNWERTWSGRVVDAHPR